MIKTMTFSEVLKRVSGDPAKLRGGMLRAARVLRYEAERFRLTERWWPTGYYTDSGARVEVRSWGRSFRWRLSGYASNGSDVL